MEQMSEVESIKDRLAKDLCPQSMQTLIRAVLVPEDVEYIPRLFDPKVEDDGKPKKEPEPPKKEEKDENA